MVVVFCKNFRFKKSGTLLLKSYHLTFYKNRKFIAMLGLNYNKQTLVFHGLWFSVGMTGFEPATPRPPGVCATRLRHIPCQL